MNLGTLIIIIRQRLIKYPKGLSDIRKTSKSCFRFQKELFGISKLAVKYVCMLEIHNVSDLSSQCFGYHISDIVMMLRLNNIIIGTTDEQNNSSGWLEIEWISFAKANSKALFALLTFESLEANIYYLHSKCMMSYIKLN